MKYLVPQEEVKVYETVFGADDLLSRKSTSIALSELVERIEDPLVIALDGPWGSGKSYFLKRWVAAHGIENKGRSTTVYFDAFEHDYLDDPLVGLVGVISERFEKVMPNSIKIWRDGKRIVASLLRPAIRISAAVATASISEIAVPAIDGLLSASKSEADKAIENFWKGEEGKRAAMSAFRKVLCDVTSADAEGSEPKKIIVVVDELDRCRPDYALSLLETIKHFFTVPNIHFVLGINLQEMENIVRQRYGLNSSARAYLQKFITLNISLPNELITDETTDLRSTYMKGMARKMDLPLALVDFVALFVCQLPPSCASLRNVDRLLTEIAIIPNRKRYGDNISGYTVVIAAALVLRNTNSDLFLRACKDAITFDEVKDFFSLNFKHEAVNQSDRDVNISFVALATMMDANVLEGIGELFVETKKSYFGTNSLPTFKSIISGHLEVIKLT